MFDIVSFNSIQFSSARLGSICISMALENGGKTTQLNGRERKGKGKRELNFWLTGIESWCMIQSLTFGEASCCLPVDGLIDYMSLCHISGTVIAQIARELCQSICAVACRCNQSSCLLVPSQAKEFALQSLVWVLKGKERTRALDALSQDQRWLVVVQFATLEAIFVRGQILDMCSIGVILSCRVVTSRLRHSCSRM